MNALQEQKRARDLTPEDRAEIIRRLEFGSTLMMPSLAIWLAIQWSWTSVAVVSFTVPANLPIACGDYSWPNKILPNRARPAARP